MNINIDLKNSQKWRTMKTHKWKAIIYQFMRVLDPPYADIT